MISEDQRTALSAPLDKARVAYRDAGRGRQVGYIEAYDAINAANRIFGFDGWSYEVLSVGIANTFEGERGPRTLYEARVRVDALGIVRTDVGTNLTSNDTADAHDTSIKGAVSDGLKRALRTFGPQFGNDLYDKSPTPQQGRQQERKAVVRACPKHPDAKLQQSTQTKKWGHVLPDGTACVVEEAA